MAYTTINKSTEHFNTKLYSGSGSAQNIVTGTFQPDLIWVKSRSNAVSHVLTDAVRGIGKQIFSDTNGTETSWTNALTAFRSDGFTTDTGGETGQSGRTYVAWNWKANGAGSANTDGTINSTVSVNTTAGFSIVSYTGTGSNGTVGHGLGVVPKVIITKARTASGRFWGVYHASNGNTGSQPLNDTQAFDVSSTYWQNTNPTSSVFSVGINGDSNASSGMIAYCFAEKTGYSKFGKYTGNGNADGSFIYTGFKPAWVLIKRTDGADTWTMYDNKRTGFNVDNNPLFANANTTESTDDDLDILSNGFKIRRNSGRINTNGANNIYMAFGQSLVGSNNVPCTAR